MDNKHKAHILLEPTQQPIDVIERVIDDDNIKALRAKKMSQLKIVEKQIIKAVKSDISNGISKMLTPIHSKEGVFYNGTILDNKEQILKVSSIVSSKYANQLVLSSNKTSPHRQLVKTV